MRKVSCKIGHLSSQNSVKDSAPIHSDEKVCFLLIDSFGESEESHYFGIQQIPNRFRGT